MTLSPLQKKIMRTLERQPGLTCKEIARIVGATPDVVNIMIRRLRMRGLKIRNGFVLVRA